MESTLGIVIEVTLVSKYFNSLVNKIFKILPIIENKEESITVYMESLGVELIGFQNLLPAVGEDPAFLSLLSIYQWIADNAVDAEDNYKIIRREVFHAISLCKKMQAQFSTEGR